MSALFRTTRRTGISRSKLFARYAEFGLTACRACVATSASTKLLRRCGRPPAPPVRVRRQCPDDISWPAGGFSLLFARQLLLVRQQLRPAEVGPTAGEAPDVKFPLGVGRPGESVLSTVEWS